MKIAKVLSKLFICISLTLLFQCSSINTESDLNNIKLYIYTNKDMQAELNIELFIKQKPVLILDKKDINKVELIRRDKDWFFLEIEIAKQMGKKIEKITSENVGKRLVFISNGKILFDPVIYAVSKQARIKVGLPPEMEREKAEELARNFSNSIEYIDKRLFSDENLDPDFRKAHDLMEEKKFDQAIKIYEELIKQEKEPNQLLLLINQIGLCYSLKKDEANAAKTYRWLIQERENIDSNNYEVFVQAYLYLIQYEKKHQNNNLSENYLSQLIETLEFVEDNYPSTIYAERASIGIGTYELFRGNIVEAYKRAIKAKQGPNKGQGYILLGLYYEYQKEFEKARKEYENLIKELPDSIESITAKAFIINLDNNKNNIDEFLETTPYSF